MSAAVTPWFPADVYPARNGVYECERIERGRNIVIRKIRWTGGHWEYTETDKNCHKEGCVAFMFKCDGDKWRGLASDPKASKP